MSPTTDHMLQVEEIMRLTVTVDQPYVIGQVNGGIMQVIPITGGSVSGRYINGVVIPGGADWNIMRNDDLAHVSAKYVLKSDDGEFIVIENEGTFVPETQAVIKTNLKFMAREDGKYNFLNKGVYVGELVPTPNVASVDIIIYRMK